MTGFFSRLEARARAIDSLLCVGLDPHPADLPAPTAAAARDFCLRLIEATADVAAAFKPNAAFFEALGPEGLAALRDVIAAVPDGIPVILDAKRGDIASTAEAYARSAFETWAPTPSRSARTWAATAWSRSWPTRQRGVFLLCKTSNPGAGDLQDLSLAGRAPGAALFEHVAELARGWNSQRQPGAGRRRDASRGAGRGAARSRPTCGSWPPASARRAASWRLRCSAGLRPMAWACSSR